MEHKLCCFRGVWNVPYISAAYLINSTLLQREKPLYDKLQLDTDMSFCQHYRDKVYQYYLPEMSLYVLSDNLIYSKTVFILYFAVDHL